MSNYYLKDKDLSYKAKGYVITTKRSLAGHCSISKESRDKIRVILKKLQERYYC